MKISEDDQQKQAMTIKNSRENKRISGGSICKSDDERLYTARLIVLGAIGGMHLAVMDMFKVSFQTFLFDLGMVTNQDNTDVALTEYSKMYSISSLLDVACTLFWGHFTDKYGAKLSLNIQILGTAASFLMLSQCTTYSSFFYITILSTVFDKYIIVADTFLGWVPQDKKLSYLKFYQITKSLMMQSGPFMGGLLVSISPQHLLTYFGALFSIMVCLGIGFNLLFWGETSRKSVDSHNGLKQLEDDEFSLGLESIEIGNPQGLSNSKKRDDEEGNPLFREKEFYSESEGSTSVKMKSKTENQQEKPSNEFHSQGEEKSGVGKSEQSIDIRSDNFDASSLSLWEISKLIWKDETGKNLIFLGIYLRMAKKYLDYGFHLWAEISRSENGLGVPRMELGTLSTCGGITSVLMFYLLFKNPKVEDLPQIIKKCFFAISLTILCMPMIVFFEGVILQALIYLTILVFMVTETIIFTSWVVLLNTCLPTSVLARTYAISLAIKGVIGSLFSFLIFKFFRWALESSLISSMMRPLNSILFFWNFALGSFGMLIYYRNMRINNNDPSKIQLDF